MLGLGAGLGVLFAPKSGEETRDEVVGAVKHGVDRVVAQADELGRRAQKDFEVANGHAKGAAEGGRLTD